MAVCNERVCLVAVVACVIFQNAAYGIPSFFRGRPVGGMLKAPPNLSGAKPPEALAVEQRLDHFNDADTRTWQQVQEVDLKSYSSYSEPISSALSSHVTRIMKANLTRVR